MISLKGKDVFAVDTSSACPGRSYMLYAPLSGAMVPVAEGDYDASAMMLADKPCYRQVLEMPARQQIDSFCHQEPDALVRLSIIPTFNCNFSCVYCYSAGGRNRRTIELETLYRALDYFFDGNRMARKDRYVSIVGGGEPLLAWEGITHAAIRRIRQLEEQHGLNVQLGLTTNGSLLTDDMVDALARYRVNVSFSFEILPDIQNIHRKHYNVVSENIHRLYEAGCTPRLRMTVTPHNVNRLTESVEECAHRYPYVKSVNMEYVIDKSFFAEVDELDVFLNNYIASFFESRNRGAELGIQVNTSVYRNMGVLADRFCSGDFCLTPDGYISGCHRFTSNQEEHFNDVVYGRVEPDGVRIDRTKFAALMAYNVHIEQQCASCPAKWHCGGHCLSCRFSYSAAYAEAICRFKRQFLARYLSEQYARAGQNNSCLLNP